MTTELRNPLLPGRYWIDAESASSFLTLAALGVIGFVAYKILK